MSNPTSESAGAPTGAPTGAPAGTPVGVHRKAWRAAPPGFFAAEAAGLAWLAEASSRGGARVVGVRDVASTHVDLDLLVPDRPTPAGADALGHALAITHGAGAPAFGAPPAGWDGDAWIGRQAQTNEPTATWGRYFAEQRVRPFVRKARDAGNLDVPGMALVDRVCDRIAGGDFDDDRPPARIHGDLWSGNVVWTSDGAVLIDPAAHGGHGMTDLAMLDLFGAPHLDRIAAAYAETAGLARGWQHLIGLHQLHPLATHAASHGPAYGHQLVETARRYA